MWRMKTGLLGIKVGHAVVGPEAIIIRSSISQKGRVDRPDALPSVINMHKGGSNEAEPK